MLFRDTSLITEFGNDATIPANISIEIPLPIPFFGGTSILIIVGVAIETVQQLESQLMLKHYKGFLE